MVFSQWARSDSSNTPWTLLFIHNQQIKSGGSGGLGAVVGQRRHQQVGGAAAEGQQSQTDP